MGTIQQCPKQGKIINITSTGEETNNWQIIVLSTHIRDCVGADRLELILHNCMPALADSTAR
jgi:hypothetical protein